MVCQGKVNSVAMMRKETELIDRDHQLEPRWEPLEPRWEPLEPRCEPLELRWKSLEYPAAEGRDVEVPPNPEDVIEDTIGNPEIPMMMASKALAQSILACSRRIAAVSEELNQAMEGYNEGRLELVKSLGSIKEQLALHAHAATAMGSTVTHQSNEVKKLLSAFDKFSHIAKWSLKGNNTLEDNIGSVKEEVGNRGEKIEQAIKVGLGEVTGLLRNLIRVIGEKGEPDPSTAPGMPMPERMEGYPSFPLPNVQAELGQWELLPHLVWLE